MNKPEYISEPWCEGWTSPADCDTCPMTECNCNPNNKTKLTIFNANAFKVKIDNGRYAIVEEQEHCSLIWPEGSDGCFPGQYYFPYEGATEFVFMVWEEGNVVKELNCQILAYSHDYGKTWCEVNKDE